MTAAGWIWVAVAVVAAGIDWVAVARAARLVERCAKPAVLLALLAAAATAQPRHSGVHVWLVLALCCGLVGDIALSFAPAEPPLAADQQIPVGPVSRQPVSPGAAQDPVGPVSRQPDPDGRAHRAWMTAKPTTELPAKPVAADPAPPSGLFVSGLASFLLGHLCYCVAMLRHGVDRLSVGFGLVLVLLALYAFGYRVLAGAYVQGGNQLTIAVALYITALGSAVVLGVGTTSLWLAYGIVAFAFSDLVLATDRFVVRRSWAPLTVATTYHAAQLLLLLGLVR